MPPTFQTHDAPAAALHPSTDAGSHRSDPSPVGAYSGGPDGLCIAAPSFPIARIFFFSALAALLFSPCFVPRASDADAGFSVQIAALAFHYSASMYHVRRNLQLLQLKLVDNSMLEL